MMGGGRGISCLLVANSDMPVMVARAGLAALPSPCRDLSGLRDGAGVPCPLMLNP